MNKKLKKFLISSFILVSTACTPAVAPLENVLDQEKFIQQVVMANPQIKSIKARVRIEVQTKDKSYNFKAGLLMTNQARMFLETYGFGVPAGYASLVNDKLNVVIPSDKEQYVGTGSSQLTKLLQINVTMNEILDPVLRKLAISEESPAKIETTGDHYVIKDADKTQFFVTPSRWIDRIERRAGYLVEYGDPIGEKTRFPHTIRLSYEHQSIKLTFDNVTLDQPIDDAAFQLNNPTEGFRLNSIE